ncbi:MAG: anthranilate phosphoribosyltransferase [Candidatus Sumerlaeia bacterium]|nr:anthranilate phosphoribosyltransferase [Candidatus Sumerlaeia bacterium]
MIIRDAIERVVHGEDLEAEVAERVCNSILAGEATPAQIAALLTGLRMKGETADEILGFARAMRGAATPMKTGHRLVVDTCGTGGDRHGTFNVSTAAAFVAAAGGVKVAKHGNRAISSKCGSADVLRELGVKIDCSPEVSQRCLDEIGICFLFAPQYHGAMKHAGPARQEIGIRTIFNMVGPLTNPAGATHQILGVYSEKIMQPLAEALQELRCLHALIVHSSDGLDEISVSSVTHVVEVEPEAIQTYDLSPGDLGLDVFPFEQLLGGDAQANAQIIENILGGHDTGARAACVAANAGAALYIGGKATALTGAVTMAFDIIRSGRAQGLLQRLREMSNA